MSSLKIILSNESHISNLDDDKFIKLLENDKSDDDYLISQETFDIVVKPLIEDDIKFQNQMMMANLMRAIIGTSSSELIIYEARNRNMWRSISNGINDLINDQIAIVAENNINNIMAYMCLTRLCAAYYIETTVVDERGK